VAGKTISISNHKEVRYLALYALRLLSIACAKKADGFTDDPELVMVRARVREHLESLRYRFPDALRDVAIAVTLNTDYRYRLVVKKTTWVELIAEMAKEQTYSNFKGEIAENKAHVRSGYEHALHDVWSVMFGLQLIAPETPDVLTGRSFPPQARLPTLTSPVGENLTSALVEVWMSRTKLLDPSRRQVPLTIKQWNQLETFGLLWGVRAVPTMDWCLENWSRFVEMVKLTEGTRPSELIDDGIVALFLKGK
jgi:hypothetical protein